MREEDLRKVLLVKAVEEADGDGAIVPPADRAAAAREAMRNAPGSDDRLLVERARMLHERIAARHPFVDKVLALLGTSRAIAAALVIAALALGAALSALDGTRRINILAFPLLGLVAWNFAVYAVLLVLALRPSRPRVSLLRNGVASLGRGLATRLVAQSRAFNAPLAGALEAFSREWYEAARPLLLARAGFAFHLAAAAVGVGLIAGLYVRGIAFDYQAGWESTFLDAARARDLLAVLYGPASWLTQIPVPQAAELEATRWRGAAGGEPAARWIHLMAASAFLYVVLPRLLLAAGALANAWRLARNTPLPASLPAYFRTAFASVEGAAAPARALIMPFAHELTPGALARLIAWLPSATGGTPTVDARASIPYGEEERFLASLGADGGDASQIVVLPFSLATTPEDENHGTVIAGVRDRLAARPGTQLLVVIDEAPYAQRMTDAPERIAERREAWRRFVEARGLKPAFVSLA